MIAAISGIVVVLYTLTGRIMIGGGFGPQILGAEFLGFAVLNWVARNIKDGEALRAIVLANFVSCTIGFLLALFGQRAGGANLIGWAMVIVYLALAVARLLPIHEVESCSDGRAALDRPGERRRWQRALNHGEAQVRRNA